MDIRANHRKLELKLKINEVNNVYRRNNKSTQTA